MAGESVFCFFQQANKLTYLQQLLHFWAQQQKQNSRFSDRSFVESDKVWLASSVSLIGDLTTTAAATETKSAWPMAHGKRDCKHKPQKDSHTDSALSTHHRHKQYCNSNSRDADEERSKCPPGAAALQTGLYLRARARVGGPLLSPYTSWFFNSFLWRIHHPFAKNILTKEYSDVISPVFLKKKNSPKKKKKNSNFLKAKIHQ